MAPAKVRQTLEALSKVQGPGPAPAFTPVHVCRAILAVGDLGPIGRIELSRRLQLGEGAVRTIIRHLTQAHFISPLKGGCTLTRRGQSFYSVLRSKLSRVVVIDARELALDKASAAILVKGAASNVRRGIEQRDAAVRAGATGACTLLAKRAEYVMPTDGKNEWRLRRIDELYKVLEDSLHPRDGDVVSIASAPSAVMAENGVIAAALTLLP